MKKLIFTFHDGSTLGDSVTDEQAVTIAEDFVNPARPVVGWTTEGVYGMINKRWIVGLLIGPEEE